ncbi:MAG TPA: NAD(P)/FAD-dependent oxidoreductase [Burkholderiales bacterium]|nr:NAD(P)/FAD-dependent oxidoreductase [Burkholderiales bacterium]
MEQAILDTAIIGSGLSGLSLARQLQQLGLNCAVFEARSRIGGRILGVTDGSLSLDLGPGWYWPQTQPRMARLVAELRLDHFAQHDRGAVLNFNDPDRKPQIYPVEGVHGGAQRLNGGMSALANGVAANLGANGLHLNHALVSAIDRVDHVELHFRCGESIKKIHAKRVALAAPPRVLEEQVRFDPPLPDALVQSMRGTYTWMSGYAKVIVTYPQAFWRSAGLSGNAFIGHDRAVLSEIFDACNAVGDRAALGAFVALPYRRRAALQQNLASEINGELVRLFGAEAENGTQYIQDWAAEKYTAGRLDQTPPAMHPVYDSPWLRQSWWQSRLYFCGSETASYAAGYLEGALEAAERVAHALAEK